MSAFSNEPERPFQALTSEIPDQNTSNDAEYRSAKPLTPFSSCSSNLPSKFVLKILYFSSKSLSACLYSKSSSNSSVVGIVATNFLCENVLTPALPL
jgi:hypothetical protein